jgi:hypothetical protein
MKVIKIFFQIIILTIVAISTKSDTTQIKVKPTFVKPSKPPEVYWSILTNKILDLEITHTQIIRDLTSELPNKELEKAEISEPTSIPSAPPIEEQQLDLTWSDLGDQLIKLEQQCDQTINYYITFKDKK